MRGHRTRLLAVVVTLLHGAAPVPAHAQEIPGVVLEAGTPVRVPLERVAESLRAELPHVPIQVGGGAPPPAGSATVTLGITTSGEIHVIYRDAGGREASRIVADSADPRAVTAAIAMIVANLHRSQVDLALAAIGPTPSTTAAAPPVPPAIPAPPVMSAPPIVVNVAGGPSAAAVATRTRLAMRTRLVTAGGVEWSFFAQPTFDSLHTGLGGVEVGAELRLRLYRFEASLGYLPEASVTTTSMSRGEPLEGLYEHTIGLVRARRLLPLGDRVTFGVAAGLGVLISAQDSWWSYSGDLGNARSDIDAAFLLGGSIDVRILGGWLYWTGRIEGLWTTAQDSEDRPFSQQAFLHLGTGVRIVP